MEFLDTIKPGANTTTIGKRLVISRKDNQSKQLTYLSIDNEQPQFDLRVWKEEDGKQQVQHGIRFTLEELQTLKDILNQKANLIDLFVEVKE